MRLYTLIGGLLGVTTGYALTIWMSINWPIVIGGKPFASVAPYTIIGFELTILFGGLATLLGLLIVGKLPYGSFGKSDKGYSPRFSGRGVRPGGRRARSATWPRSTRCCAPTTRWRSALSRRSSRARWIFAVGALSLTALPGCWEQWSESWFPQMKWQKAVQAFERVEFKGRLEGFVPPEGAVPGRAARADVRPHGRRGARRPQQPADKNDLSSLENGRRSYTTYCQPCHGAGGMGDGPVSSAYPGRPGPFAGVFPLVGLTTGRSDGYIYNLIRVGTAGCRRMPTTSASRRAIAGTS